MGRDCVRSKTALGNTMRFCLCFFLSYSIAATNQHLLSQLFQSDQYTSDGTRTRNPRLRRPMPYPLGHGGIKLLEGLHDEEL